MEHLLDFNAILGGKTEHSVAYAVSYIVAPKELKAIKMKTAVTISAGLPQWQGGLQETRRCPLPKKDDDTAEVTLRKGTNVMVSRSSTRNSPGLSACASRTGMTPPDVGDGQTAP